MAVFNEKNPRNLRKVLFGEGKISRRFRNVFIALFALAFICMLGTMFAMYNRIITQVSFDYAGRYAASSATAFSAHIRKELGLLAKAAQSRAIVEWLKDEGDPAKKALAYDEMADVVMQLYSTNIYIGSRGTLLEYGVGEAHTVGVLEPVSILREGARDDEWFFNCLSSDEDYLLSINLDHFLDKKRVWLDYKIIDNGQVIGVICTGLEFSHLAEELFSHAYDTYMRSIIVDEHGVVQMDSDLMDDEGFLYHTVEISENDAFSDPFFLSTMESFISRIDSYFDYGEGPLIIHPSSGRYRYATITPIRSTKWSAVVLYNSSSLLSLSRFLPAFTGILLLLIAFTLSTNLVSYRLIFQPLDLLINSLSRQKENYTEPIYGIDRDDEFGSLSKTIDDLFIKANYDALTGVYNRRFMETLLQQNMEFLHRTNGMLSILMADVDFFKLYNDAYGHQEGDECLKTVARVLSESVTRNTDFVARYGGEEFVAVLPNTDEAGARLVAQKMLDNIRRLRIPHKTSTVESFVTISLGVTSGQVFYSQNWTEYVKHADDALYTSKQSGRDQYTYLAFSAEPDKSPDPPPDASASQLPGT
ncbi:MAG: diguanylate cyclase [Clostridiales bacterium]|nr:diguanylate cyclase [Clostridiales bacterium]